MSIRYTDVDSYKVLARIGSGGMADVFKAVDTRDGRTVALKIPKADRGIREAERAGAELQLRLSEVDGRVPAVYEIGESNESEMYIAMEYVAGEDLADRIGRGALEPREAARIAIELCELLAAAQKFTRTIDGRTDQGIVHGDLKPKNVRLGENGVVKVLDFGIAKALSRTRPLTRNEFGSLPYSSPERIESGNVDAQSDLWAVSVVLYEMLSGRQPFRGDSTRRLEEHIRLRASAEPLPENCPPLLAAILRKALAPDLTRRYASALLLRDDLRAFLDGRATLAQVEAVALLAQATRRGSAAPTPARNHEGETRRTLNGSGAATRRTFEPIANGHGASSETRRTLSVPHIPVAPTPAPSPVPVAATAAVPSAAKRRHLHLRWWAVPALVGIALVANEAQVMAAAGSLRSTLPGLRSGQSEVVWKMYQQLASRSFLRVGTFALAGDVKDWFVAAADERIADFRSGTPTIRESGWREASTWLGHAAALSPGDRSIRARALLCRGHLARINGVAEKSRGSADATKDINEAARSFEAAAQLRPRWPDASLGLASTYAYGLEDPEQAREALNRAEDDGYTPGNREVAMLGDAYRLRAERTWAREGEFSDLPHEDKYLGGIRHDCEQALEQYDTVPTYGDVSRNIRNVEDLLAKVDSRTGDLRRERLRKAGFGILAPLFGRRSM
jgi:serine/threonine protein kinase